MDTYKRLKHYNQQHAHKGCWSGTFAEPEFLEIVARVLANKRPKAAEAVANALANGGALDPAAEQALMGVLKDPRPENDLFAALAFMALPSQVAYSADISTTGNQTRIRKQSDALLKIAERTMSENPYVACGIMSYVTYCSMSSAEFGAVERFDLMDRVVKDYHKIVTQTRESDPLAALYAIEVSSCNPMTEPYVSDQGRRWLGETIYAFYKDALDLAQQYKDSEPYHTLTILKSMSWHGQMARVAPLYASGAWKQIHTDFERLRNDVLEHHPELKKPFESAFEHADLQFDTVLNPDPEELPRNQVLDGNRSLSDRIKSALFGSSRKQ